MQVCIPARHRPALAGHWRSNHPGRHPRKGELEAWIADAEHCSLSGEEAYTAFAGVFGRAELRHVGDGVTVALHRVTGEVLRVARLSPSTLTAGRRSA